MPAVASGSGDFTLSAQVGADHREFTDAACLTIRCSHVVRGDGQGVWASEGGNPEEVARLTDRLNAFAATLARDPRGVPHTAAAGGLSGGLWGAFGAGNPAQSMCSTKSDSGAGSKGSTRP